MPFYNAVKNVRKMPSLFKFLFTLILLAGLGFGAMVSLAFFVEPNERTMTISIPSKRLNP